MYFGSPEKSRGFSFELRTTFFVAKSEFFILYNLEEFQTPKTLLEKFGIIRGFKECHKELDVNLLSTREGIEQT